MSSGRRRVFTPEAVIGSPGPKKEYSLREILDMWPQASGELRGFANALRARGMGITAAQIDLAIQLANVEFCNKRDEADDQ